MPGMGSNPHERNAEEPFRNDFRNLQRVKLLPFLLRQDTLHCPAQGSWPVATQDGGSYFTGQVEKVPIRTADVSRQRRAIKILDVSPFTESGTYLQASRLLDLSWSEKSSCEPPRPDALTRLQTKGVGSFSHRLHPVQLAVSRAKEGFNCFAVLGIDSHADARGKRWLKTIRG